MRNVFISCLLVLTLAISGCPSPSNVNSGNEGVMVLKPWIFGHGGVDPQPILAGSTWTAFTTEVVRFDVRPLNYPEHFDVISADNAPVSFDVHALLKIKDNKTPELLSKFGVDWYVNNVQQQFHTIVRDEVQRYKLFDLTTTTTTREVLQRAITKTFQEQILAKQNLPVELHNITVGSIMPPKEVLDQTVQTVSQEQRKMTMVQFRLAELEREKAEKQRGIADKAFMKEIGLTAQEYVQLRQIEVQKELVKESPQALTVYMGMNPIVSLPLPHGK